MARIDLILIGEPPEPLFWERGSWVTARPDPASVSDALATTAHTEADAVLCWSSDLPLPDDALLDRLLDGPCDAWHAGLALGLEGQPVLWDRVDPLSMFAAPLDPAVEATSWRVSLRALLVRREVIEQLGSSDGSLDTLSGAGLDIGQRWIRAGALIRHVPALLGESGAAEPDPVPTQRDAVRMVVHHRGRTWARWALVRGAITGAVPARLLPGLLRLTAGVTPTAEVHYQGPPRSPGSIDRTVTVVLPTIDRYDYLVPLLRQLAEQTRPPSQVVVVDQTPEDRRRHDLTDVAPDLPVEVIGQAKPGQSTARNAALERATGEMLLFVDDDDEIGPTLIANHLERLVDGVDASCGAVDDATAGPPPPGFRHRRASNVFPTNNTMLRRSALERSGLFDPVFDHGPRADHDLGTRLHLSGAVLVYDPTVEVFHHHAPMGGLRTHGARKVTRASSRRSLVERNIPAVTQLYLGHRYFTAEQRREGRWIGVLSTLSGDGPPLRRMARAAVQLVLLPQTHRRVIRNDRQAEALAAQALAIPRLPVASQPATTP